MNKISFTAKSLIDGSEIIGPKALEEKYILLSYFISETRYNINEVLQDLESVASGEKTFEEIKDHPQVAWSFGEESGKLECTKDTAYFIAYEQSTIPSMEMPLQELIEILKDWKVFLGE